MIDNRQYEPFKVHLADVSYFSGKLEAYMRYKEIPYQRVEMTASGGVEIYAHTGVRKVPAMEAANGQWFRETTNMITWLEGRYPVNSVMPEDPALLFLSKLVEDYADEWLTRCMFHFRWARDVDQIASAGRIAGSMMPDLNEEQRAEQLRWPYRRCRSC